MRVIRPLSSVYRRLIREIRVDFPGFRALRALQARARSIRATAVTA
jgi:hypothetical protein